MNLIFAYIYHSLPFNLQVDAKKGEGTSFFFMSRNIKDCDKLLILIHGSGAVRAGQWARRSVGWRLTMYSIVYMYVRTYVPTEEN